MKYLILTQNSTSYAQSISEALWGIRYPSGVRQGDEVTTMYCGHIVHSDGRVALAFPDEDLYIHPQSNMQPLIDLITAGLTEQQASDVADHLNNLDQVEGRMIEDVLPPLYSSNLKEYAFMESDGWFNA